MRTIMSKEEFCEASRKECAQFFTIWKKVKQSWDGRTTEVQNNVNKDLVAEAAAAVQRAKHGPLLLDRIRSGSLVVPGMKP